MIEVRERPQRVEHAYLVGVRRRGDTEAHVQSLLDELGELVRNLDIGVSHQEIATLREPNPRTLLGPGQTQRIIAHARELGCDVLVFDEELSPAQQRAWEQDSGILVIDRHEVILDIFSDRAHTKEAVLQVELARAEYSLPRLRRAWTHLSRQRGGGVTQRGEGEAQIELDQRMVRDRIASLKREIASIERHRATQRKARMKIPLPTGAIVGYTNAGKSSLLNKMTGATVLAADQLFATLDPTTKQLVLPSGIKVLLTDTVGFVRKLPHALVDAFKATLEEAVLADFLVHVVDVTSPEAAEHQETTQEVLRELGAGDKPTILVGNKADQLDTAAQPPLRPSTPMILTSAHTGQGLEELQGHIERLIEQAQHPARLIVPHARYDIVSRLHELGCVRQESAEADGVHLEALVPTRLEAFIAPFRTNGTRINGRHPG